MDTIRAEAAYCAGRIIRSTASAVAATNCCARKSHQTMTALYQRRYADLTRSIANLSRE